MKRKSDRLIAPKLWAVTAWVVGTTAACAQPHLSLPVAKAAQPDTNLYWLPFTWDAMTNVTSYSLTVWSNGLVQQNISSTTNYAAVSNLTRYLDAFEFRAAAINQGVSSDYSDAAPLHWTTLYTSSDLTNWLKAPAVQFDYSTNAAQYLRLSNWSYATELRKQ